MQRLTRWLALAGAAAAMASGGCGGGAPAVVTECGLDVHTPNYARYVTRLFVWPEFPVSVSFIRDAQFTPARRTAALSGFDRWTDVLGPHVSYIEVDEAARADITVRFVGGTSNGLARLTFSGQTMVRAQIEVGTRQLDDLSISCIAAHEFGHALGINGHSPAREDLMYPSYTVGRPCAVSERDANTMRTGYCDLFAGRAHLLRTAPPGAPVETVVIHCPQPRSCGAPEEALP